MPNFSLIFSAKNLRQRKNLTKKLKEKVSWHFYSKKSPEKYFLKKLKENISFVKKFIFKIHYTSQIKENACLKDIPLIFPKFRGRDICSDIV
jgi:hypothetical protein